MSNLQTPETASPRAPQGVPGYPRPDKPAHIIGSDEEAIAVAHALAEQFAAGAAERDSQRILPIDELDAFSQSGLWSINVPKRFGGPEVSYATLTQVVQIIAAADPSIAQISQNHLGIIAAIRSVSDEAQQRELFGLVLQGVRFGNAFPNSTANARRISKPFLSITATTCWSTARNSIRAARCWRIWCPSSRSTIRGAPGMPSPSATRRG